MRNHHGIQIPITVNDWELYTEEGCFRAANELTETLIYSLQVYSLARCRGDTIPKALREANKFMELTQGKWADLGASDTEPQSVKKIVFAQYLMEQEKISKGTAYEYVSDHLS